MPGRAQPSEPLPSSAYSDVLKRPVGPLCLCGRPPEQGWASSNLSTLDEPPLSHPPVFKLLAFKVLESAGHLNLPVSCRGGKHAAVSRGLGGRVHVLALFTSTRARATVPLLTHLAPQPVLPLACSLCLSHPSPPHSAGRAD